MKSFRDFTGRRKKKPTRSILPNDPAFPHKDINQIYEGLKSYKEFRNEQDMVEVEGYGKITRRQAKESCIEKLQSIVQALQFGQEVGYEDLEKAKAFFVAFNS